MPATASTSEQGDQDRHGRRETEVRLRSEPADLVVATPEGDAVSRRITEGAVVERAGAQGEREQPAGGHAQRAHQQHHRTKHGVAGAFLLLLCGVAAVAATAGGT